MNKRRGVAGIVGIAGLALTILLIVSFLSPPITSYAVSIQQPMGVNAFLDPTVRHKPGVQVDYVQVVVTDPYGNVLVNSVTTNVVTYNGYNFIACALGQGQTANSTCAPWLDIMLFNNSAYTPAITDLKCDPGNQSAVEFGAGNNGYGLSPAAGTFQSWSSNGYAIGFWNVTKTFTLSVTPANHQIIYGACLTTSTTVNTTNLAAAATFSQTAPLNQQNDNVKVTWVLNGT